MRSPKHILTQNIPLLSSFSMLLICLMVLFYLAPIHQPNAGWTEAVGWIFAGALALAGTIGFVTTAPVSLPKTLVAIIGIIGVGVGGGMIGLGIGEVLEEIFRSSSP